MQPIELVLFDLGGVVVEFDGLHEIANLMREPEDEAQCRARWLESPTIRAFESGRLDTDDFAERFQREWQLSVSPSEFLTHFERWNRGLLPGADTLLRELAARTRIAALSNSNALHWEQNRRRGIEDFFERAFSSHQLGHHKPAPEIYRAALDALGLAPAAVLFLDDNQPNVDAALALGLEAERVVGVAQARDCLVQRGVLEPSR